jgi:hypothetical protein
VIVVVVEVLHRVRAFRGKQLRSRQRMIIRWASDINAGVCFGVIAQSSGPVDDHHARMAVGVLRLTVAGSDDDLEDPDIPLVEQDAMGFGSGNRTVKVIGPPPRAGVETHVVKVT